MEKSKPFCISKSAVLLAWTKVRVNKGAAGVDEVSVKEFEKKLDNNLYRIWNRMSSGSYVPPPVKRVMIPKADGKQRALGIPTVGASFSSGTVIVKMELASAVSSAERSRRWNKAPVEAEDGTLIARDRGTPQGGVISPLLANIFLHSFSSGTVDGSGISRLPVRSAFSSGTVW
jgi:RNA-directed DNA polymerase